MAISKAYKLGRNPRTGRFEVIASELKMEIENEKWWKLIYFWFGFEKKRKNYLKILKGEKYLEDFDYLGSQVARQVVVKNAIINELIRRVINIKI